jgi:hypothetical protein
MPSKDFQDFTTSCFPKTWGEDHDGLNHDALLRLVGNELSEAEKLILNGISRTWGTNRTIEAAGFLRLHSASKLLRKELVRTQIKGMLASLFILPFLIWGEYYQERIVTVAWSLYQIEKYPKSLAIIIGEIEKSKRKQSYYFRIYAFNFLISFGDEHEAVTYLKKLLSNKQFSYDAMYALESIKDGLRLPFHGKYSEMYERAKKRLDQLNNKTWEWL